MTEVLHPAEELFELLVDATAEERARVLDERCGSNAELRAEVEQLLRADDALGDTFLSRKPASFEGVYLTPGTRVGQFTVRERIGEGGMGTVYAAEQESPRRDVALKVIRADRISPSSLRRFRHEAEILGSLQHGGIAQVFEAGHASVEAQNGARFDLPYLAMELVRGEPLIDYVRARSLTRRARIDLLTRICDAVQHAHERGVIHRDLKPENVLVCDGPDVEGGVPKILDFGIARATRDVRATFAAQTIAGQLIGSLACMSPEQVSGRVDAVDARSDVYALGVLLYRLLTDRNPIDTETCSVPEAVRRIAEGDPPKLSYLDSSLKGDLTVIASKALEADKSRRYPSAAALADDLRRYLRGLPIAARTDSAIYVIGKTIRRNKSLSVAALAIVASLVALAVVTTLKNRRLSEQLTASTIERARLTGLSENFLLAEEMLWKEFLADPDSRHAYWALWELYSRDACLGARSVDHDRMRALAFLPDGRAFVTTDGEEAIVVWDAGGRGPIGEIDTGRRLESLAVHPSGERVAVGAKDGTVGEWSLADGTLVRELGAHEGWVRALAYSPDGGTLVTGGRDGALLVSREDGTVTRVPYENSATEVLRFRDDGELLAAGGSDGRVTVWGDLAAEPLVSYPANSVVRALAFSPAGNVVASGGDGTAIYLRDLDDPEGELVELDAPNGAIRFLEFHPVRPDLLLASGWWKLLAWSVEDRTNVPLLNLGFHFGAFTEDASRLVTTGDRNLRIWDLAPTNRRRTTGFERMAFATVAPRNGWAAAGSADSRVRVFDMETGDVVRDLDVGFDRVRSIVFGPSERTMFVGGSNGAGLFDLESGGLLRFLDAFRQSSSSSFRFSPDGTRYAHISADGGTGVYDSATGEPIVTVDVTEGQVLGIALNPIDGSLATTFRDYDADEFGIRVWNADGSSKWESLTWPAMFGQDSALDIIPWCPEYSSDGKRLAAGGWGNVIFVWDAATGETQRVLRGHQAVIWDIAFPDGDASTIASVSDDGTVKLWDVEDERCLATLVDPDGEGRATQTVEFSGDGRLLVVAGFESVTVWDLEYFDRHVAGNLPYQLQRFRSEVGDENAQRLEAWATDVFARPWPRLR